MNKRTHRLAGAVLGLLALLSPLASAQDPAGAFVFTAPPREPAARGELDYGPIAQFLSQATGQRFVYQHPGSWLSYMKNMQRDRFDLIFDGPHFISWRIARLGHVPIVRLPGSLDFEIIVRRDSSITSVAEIAGRGVCAHAPPNLATLTLHKQFPNLMRLPRIHSMRGFKNHYTGLMAGKCEAAILPTKIYQELLAKNPGQTRSLFRSEPLPHQGFSAGRRISAALAQQISEALLSPAGVEATKRLRERFAGGKGLIPANRREYTGFSTLLSEMVGFD